MPDIRKAGQQSKENPFQFILSDETVDRAGDVIRADGWDLTQFKRNPVALFGHDHSNIVGIWEDIKVVGKKLVGTLKFAKPGTSQLVDTARSLVEQQILKAVSVGFQPLDAKPRKDGGMEFTRSVLHEVSLVAVPCNPNALAYVKAMNPNIADILFAKSGPTGGDTSGQSTHLLTTPRLDAARLRLKELGIDY
jgi:HK97 family phage prohead protease